MFDILFISLHRKCH